MRTRARPDTRRVRVLTALIVIGCIAGCGDADAPSRVPNKKAGGDPAGYTVGPTASSSSRFRIVEAEHASSDEVRIFAKTVVGQPLERASRRAAALGVVLRVKRIDGHLSWIVNDHEPLRVNVAVRNGRVSRFLGTG